MKKFKVGLVGRIIIAMVLGFLLGGAHAADYHLSGSTLKIVACAIAIMAALGVLQQSLLGFGEQEQALMIALCIAMDNFGTACNVTGDGALALIINKFYKGGAADA